MRILGLPIEPPQVVINRIAGDLGAIARFAVVVPAQIERMLELGEEIATTGVRMLEIAERLDRRAEAIMSLGDRLDRRAEAIMALGERLDGRAVELLELGGRMSDLGGRIDVRGAEIADRAGQVVETGSDLIAVMPTFERALEMATPLEGAIDRFGRLVDRLPGGARRARPGTSQAEPAASEPALPEPPLTAASEDHGPRRDNNGPGRVDDGPGREPGTDAGPPLGPERS